MLLLRRGDILPLVAAVQALLNAYRPKPRHIAVDGIFGPRTQQAVADFQKDRHLPLTVKVDAPTWRALNAEFDLRVHDHVDIFDPVLRHSARVLEAAGAHPTIAGGSCNGVAALVGELRGSGIGRGQLLLLRLHGHGNKGTQALSYGTTVHTYFDAINHLPVPDLHHVPDPQTMDQGSLEAAKLTALYSQVSARSLTLPHVLHELSLLAPLFHPHGSVEFHGCQVGGRAVGRHMLLEFANRVGVPAVGARHSQMTHHAVRYHGPVEVQCPRSVSLRNWAHRLPQLQATMSIMPQPAPEVMRG